eukprot:5688670-Alexandrium_andersonii.AAC.1
MCIRDSSPPPSPVAAVIVLQLPCSPPLSCIQALRPSGDARPPSTAAPWGGRAGGCSGRRRGAVGGGRAGGCPI